MGDESHDDGRSGSWYRVEVPQRLNFDVNATTALHPAVRDHLARSWMDASLDGNPASAHQLGQKARACLEQARRRLAAAIDADPLSVVWTSGGTESNALALMGRVQARRQAQEPFGVAASPLEHPCITESLAVLERSGVPVHTLPVDEQGRLPSQPPLDSIGPEIGVLCMMLASHELGNLYPVQAWAQSLRETRPELWIHCDAVQGVGKCQVSFRELGVHSMGLSAHKFGGPKGIGALVIERGASLQAQMKGGSQERGFRAGTPCVRLADAMALAAELAVADQKEREQRCRLIHQRLRSSLASLSGIQILGDSQEHVGNTLCLLSETRRGQDLMIALDLEGFRVSTGAACSVGASAPSAGIMAMGFSESMAKGVLRLSWGPDTSVQDADALVLALRTILERSGGLA